MTFNSLLDPYDPLNGYMPSSGEPDRDAVAGCLAPLCTVIIIFLMLCVVSLFVSCTTQKIISGETTEHRTHEILQQMDSLLRIRSVVQQDSTWRQEILRQFQSIREKSDTSHYVVTDTTGKVIKEKIVINNTREVTSETDREQLTVMASHLAVMDSTVQAQSVTISRIESLLNEKQQTVEKEVPAKFSWFQQMQLWLGRLLMVAIAVCAVWWILKKKTWWMSLLRKVL